MEKNKEHFKMYLPYDVAKQIDNLEDDLYKKTAQGMFLAFVESEEEINSLMSLASINKDKEGYRLSEIDIDQFAAPKKIVCIAPKQRAVTNNSVWLELQNNPSLERDRAFMDGIRDRRHMVDKTVRKLIPVDKFICRLEYAEGKTIVAQMTDIRVVEDKKSKKKKCLCKYKINIGGEVIWFDGVIDEKTLFPVFGNTQIRSVDQTYTKIFHIGRETDPQTRFFSEEGKIFPDIKRGKINVLEKKDVSEKKKVNSSIDKKDSSQEDEFVRYHKVIKKLDEEKTLSLEERHFLDSFLEKYNS